MHSLLLLLLWLQVVPNTDLVVGDVLMVNMGDKVVADGIMIDGFHLVVDEASLTGQLGLRSSQQDAPARASDLCKARWPVRSDASAVAVCTAASKGLVLHQLLIKWSGSRAVPESSPFSCSCSGLRSARCDIGVLVLILCLPTVLQVRATPSRRMLRKTPGSAAAHR